jgi:hypothetical protein
VPVQGSYAFQEVGEKKCMANRIKTMFGTGEKLWGMKATHPLYSGCCGQNGRRSRTCIVILGYKKDAPTSGTSFIDRIKEDINARQNSEGYEYEQHGFFNHTPG